MNCRKCKVALPDGAKFCHVCGVRQEIQRTRRSRGNRQGCAIKRGSTWTAVWTEETYVDPDDEQKRIHQKRRWKGGFRTKTEALTYAANPIPMQPETSATLRDYWETFKASDFIDLGGSKQTAYKIAWGKLEGLAGRDIGSLTIQELQAVVDEKAPTYYPARDMRTVLSHLYKRAVAEGNARTNLAEFIRIPPLEEKETEPFTEAELKKLWEAYGAGNSFLGYVLLMIYTGMMPGELLRLQPDMIDWDKCEIVGCGLKTKKRKETPVVFPDMITPVLRDLVARSDGRKYVAGMNKDNFYKAYHEAVTAAGVRDLPPYSCRHTTATALALGNIAPSVIQQVMRHTKFSTTQRYIHPDMEAAKTAVNAIGGVEKGLEN